WISFTTTSWSKESINTNVHVYLGLWRSCISYGFGSVGVGSVGFGSVGFGSVEFGCSHLDGTPS
ncbi:hypothetical protein BgiBS90_004631, partial [Biomphalaria glabrata]